MRGLIMAIELFGPKKNTRKSIRDEFQFLLKDTPLSGDENVDNYIFTDFRNGKLSHGAYSLGCEQNIVTAISTICKAVLA